MPNLASAKKAHKQAVKRRTVNVARRSALKSSIKKLLIALEQGEQHTQVDGMLRTVAGQLARARSKKVIKANTASRTLSRLAKRVARIGRPAA